ncbi:recombinase family protein [uncultured Cohaesibacter sp.]|uniref:recombinase family protein n=1 Tax=uncultured Cohaesibacter sp. TaxID=1002546 RepID=UPI002AA80964|nr:recombinase family protein [uncultured Cohaesibacter sp.]
MKKYGYARVSTTDQDLTVQIEALAPFTDMIREEKQSGTSLKNRSELRTILDFIHDGDVLVVTRIDRLARSVADLSAIVKELMDKGASLEVTEQNIDTNTATGKAFLQMLGVFAEFETNIRRERQLEGIAKAKQEGKYRGRKKSIDREAVKKLQQEGKGPAAIAKELGVARSSVYRLLEEQTG